MRIESRKFQLRAHFGWLVEPLVCNGIMNTECTCLDRKDPVLSSNPGKVAYILTHIRCTQSTSAHATHHGQRRQRAHQPHRTNVNREAGDLRRHSEYRPPCSSHRDPQDPAREDLGIWVLASLRCLLAGLSLLDYEWYANLRPQAQTNQKIITLCGY